MVPGAVVLRTLIVPGKGGWYGLSEEVIADLRGLPGRVPFRSPVRLWRAGQRRHRGLREMHPPCPLVTPEGVACALGRMTPVIRCCL